MSEEQDRLNDDTRPNELGDDTVPTGTGDSTMESPPGGTGDDPDRFDSPTLAPSASDSPPRKPDRSRLSIQQIGDYEILSELGRGGFGVVFLAEDPKLGREVAVKVLAPQLASEAGYVERFEREAKSAARLKHPNIVSVYSTGESRGMHYMVMEKIEGRTVQELSKAGPLEEKRCIEILIDVCKGLSYAHEHGTIHRDLKPANIMVEDESKRVVIMDFGLARPEQGGNTLTQSGVALGTPVYMSPEQAKMSLGNVDRRSDLYSLGIVLYEMLTGRVPFTGKTPIEVLRKVVDDDPVPPRKLAKRMSQDLEAVILKAVEKDRDRRYQTATEFQEDLERILKGESVKAKKRTAIGRGIKWVKRNRKMLAIAAGASMVVASLVLFVASRRVQDARRSADSVTKMFEEKTKEDWAKVAYFSDSFSDQKMGEKWTSEAKRNDWVVKDGWLSYLGCGDVLWLDDPVLGDFKLELDVDMPDWSQDLLEQAVEWKLKDKGLPLPPPGMKLAPQITDWTTAIRHTDRQGSEIQILDGARLMQTEYILQSNLQLELYDVKNDQHWRVLIGWRGWRDGFAGPYSGIVRRTREPWGAYRDPCQITKFQSKPGKYRLALSREGDHFIVMVDDEVVFSQDQPMGGVIKMGLASFQPRSTESDQDDYGYSLFAHHRFDNVSLCAKELAERADPLALPERYLYTGDFALAEDAIKSALKMNLLQSALGRAKGDLSQALSGQGKTDEASQCLREAIKAGLSDLEQKCLAVRALHDAGGRVPLNEVFNRDEAVDACERFISWGDDLAVYELGELLRPEDGDRVLGWLSDKRQGFYSAGLGLLHHFPTDVVAPRLADLIEQGKVMLAATLYDMGKKDLALEKIDSLLKGGKRPAGDVAQDLGFSHIQDVVPMLVELLGSDKEWDREMAARALGFLGSEESIPALMKLASAAKDGMKEDRCQAIWSLGALGAKEAARLFTECLSAEKGSLWYTSFPAAEGLQIVQGQSEIPSLLSLLESKSWETRAGAATALGLLKAQDAVPMMTRMLEDENEKCRIRAAIALGRLGSEAGLPILLQVLGDRNLQYHDNLSETIAAVGALQAIETIPLLVNLLPQRPSVIEDLGKLKASEASNDVAPFLKNEESQLRAYAALALGRMGAREYISAVAEVLYDKEWHCRCMAAKSLGLLNATELTPELKEKLRDSRTPFRHGAAMALAEMKICDSMSLLVDMHDIGFAYEPLMVFLGRGCPVPDNFTQAEVQALVKNRINESSGEEEAVLSERDQAIVALAAAYAEPVRQCLIEGLSNRKWEVRLSAVRLLGKIQGNRCGKDVAALIEDSCRAVRKEVAKAIVENRAAEAGPEIQRLLTSNKPSARMFAAYVLACLNDSTGKDILSEMANMDNLYWKELASEGLAALKESEPSR